jgi:periplasmic protein TonB
MPRMFRIVSIVVHVVVVAWVFVAQLLAVGPLPVPRTPLTFVGAIPVAIVEPPAPPRAQTPALGRTAAASPDAAPLVAPEGVAPERPVERRAAPVSVVDGITTDLPGFGTRIERAAPPLPSPPREQLPIRLHSGMHAPRKIVNVDPIYPRVAQTARIQGVVILEAVIDAQGRVAAARVLRSIPLLDQAAVDAVQQWTFTPALLNGAAVPVVMTVTVNFTLTDR